MNLERQMKILLAVASLIPILPLVPEVLGSASGEPAYLYAAPMPDFNAAREEAVRFLSDYLRIDTVNPPGNETRGAQYLQSILAREGIPSEIFELVPGRGNLVARIGGSGAKRPLLIMDTLMWSAWKGKSGLSIRSADWSATVFCTDAVPRTTKATGWPAWRRCCCCIV